MLRLLASVFLAWFSLQPAIAVSLDAAQLEIELNEAKTLRESPNQPEIIKALQTALRSLDDQQASMDRSAEFQEIIASYPQQIKNLRQQIANAAHQTKKITNSMSSNELEQEILKVNNEKREEMHQAQQEREKIRNIRDSAGLLPQQLAIARQRIDNEKRRLQGLKRANSPLVDAQRKAYQAEILAEKAWTDELEQNQRSASNRQELARLRAELHQTKAQQLDSYLQTLHDKLNNLRQKEKVQVLESAEELEEQSPNLPKIIREQFRTNRKLFGELHSQSRDLQYAVSRQEEVANQMQRVRRELSAIRELGPQLGVTGMLGDTLRARIARLPEAPTPQLSNNEIKILSVDRLHYEDMMEDLRKLRAIKSDNHQPFTAKQSRIFNNLLNIQSERLNELASGCDNLILEISRLQVAHAQLVDMLGEVKEATHRYLFWTANVPAIDFKYPLNVLRDLSQLLSLDTFSRLGKAILMITTSLDTLLPIIAAVVLVGFSFSTRRHFDEFLARAASKVGKVTQDHFWLTIRTVIWSVLVALPIPILWAALGYGLQHAWQYPGAVAIGAGVTATLPLLWGFMISAAFARPQGLFVVHFRWPPKQVARAMRYYSLAIGVIVPQTMLLIALDTFLDHKFYVSLGRLCFIFICGALSIVTITLKRAGIPLYLDKEGNGKNLFNTVLWNLLIAMPLVAAFAACLGYLETAQALLTRLETSVAIWFILLVVYHIIRRWMLIQRRRIAFDRARQRRSEILAQRARDEEAATLPTEIEIEEPVINLDAISAQSLRLVRSLLTLIALVSMIVLWSEIHSAFSFLVKIDLWNTSTTVQGVESTRPITLGSVLIAILVFTITAQLVRNMPALLELAVLQHLSLTPGTGYAITTLTKYLLILIGGLAGFSVIGIDWTKLQLLVAALGVGLGIGLQEIFANFVSGLIILFEKPIRIGDTVTIRDLTGTVTRINTRATTIVDWDRKEIVVPNKAFITEQLVNWSLSDTITRTVLTIPAPAEANTEEITNILLTAAAHCSYVLNLPAPEAYLVDLHQGIQLFELRIHAAEMSHRMPMRHQLHSLILEGYRLHGLEMPFPPFQVRVDTINTSAQLKSTGRKKVFDTGAV